MEAIALLEGRSRALLVAVRGDQRRVQVNDQPVPRSRGPGCCRPGRQGPGRLLVRVIRMLRRGLSAELPVRSWAGR